MSASIHILAPHLRYLHDDGFEYAIELIVTLPGYEGFFRVYVNICGDGGPGF